MSNAMEKEYASFADFYPVYLGEHNNRTCRELHFVSSTLILFCLGGLLLTGEFWLLAALLACGYGLAWTSHFGFEDSQPATFHHPLYSLISDWVMYWQMLTGQTSF